MYVCEMWEITRFLEWETYKFEINHIVSLEWTTTESMGIRHGDLYSPALLLTTQTPPSPSIVSLSLYLSLTRSGFGLSFGLSITFFL